jgi:hypothetical protein
LLLFHKASWIHGIERKGRMLKLLSGRKLDS